MRGWAFDCCYAPLPCKPNCGTVGMTSVRGVGVLVGWGQDERLAGGSFDKPLAAVAQLAHPEGPTVERWEVTMGMWDHCK